MEGWIKGLGGGVEYLLVTREPDLSANARPVQDLFYYDRVHCF